MGITFRRVPSAGVIVCLVAGAVFAGEVSLRVDVPPGLDHGAWPVTFGVPFPEGVLPPGAPVVVTADGRAVPTQSSPLATWTKDGSSIRWLLVDFQADAATARDGTFVLHFGAGAPPAEHARGVAVSRQGDRLVIDTGAAEYVLRDRGRLQIESVKVARGGGPSHEGATLIAPESPVRFTVTDHTGVTYEASGDATPDGAIIEDQGPCRVGIKSEGWYVAPGGAKFCRHVIRLEFFAGQSLMRVLHTFIFTGTSESHQVRDLVMELPGTIRSEAVGAVGISAEDPSAAVELSQPDAFSLVQDCRDRWHPEYKVVGTASGRELGSGERAGGWARVAGKDAAITAALREGWQNYPYEMEVDGGTVRVHFWPLHGRMMDLRTEALLAPYGADALPIIDRFFQDQNPPYKRSIFDVYNNAMGMAKTHEVWVDFASGDPGGRTESLVTQANHPVLAAADPAWSCATAALGPLHPHDPVRFPEVEAALDAMFDRFVNWQRQFMDYGWFDYGDIHCDARDWEYGGRFAGGRTATMWRYWDSTHYGFPISPWLFWLRTGQRKYLEFAEANARHCIDIDRCHHGDEKERYKGGHYYCDWSIIHWNRRTESHINYDRLEYMLYSYYMRGYRRGLDAMKDWGDLHLRYYRAGKGQDPFQMILPPRLSDIRHYGPPLGNMTELYRATWDERYLKAAKDWAAALVEMVPKKPEGWQDLGAVHYCWEGMGNYVRLTGDRRLRKALVSYARAAVDGHFGYMTHADAAEGFFQTGDTAFLDAGKARLVGLLANVNLGADPRARGAAGLWENGCYPFAMRSIPTFLAAAVAAPDDWQKRNLPLTSTNRSVHMAGPRLPVVHVRPDPGEAAELRMRLGTKQALDLVDPAGKILRHVEAREPARIDTLVLPATDGGTYTLSFPLRPTRHAGDYIDRGNVDLLDIRKGSLAIAPSTEDGMFCLFGPRLHFMVPPGTVEFTVEADTSSTWAAYGWFPVVSIHGPDGLAVDTRSGPGLLRFTIAPAPGQTGAVWSIGPVGRVEAPSVNATWHKPIRPFDAHFPAWFRLSANLPQFVTTRADLFFVPPESDR